MSFKIHADSEWRRRIHAWALAWLISVAGWSGLRAQAPLPIPEPGLVIQGDLVGMVFTNRPRILWQARRGAEVARAAAAVVVGTAGNVRHVAEFQFETLVAGAVASPGKLALTDTLEPYLLSVTVNGLDYPLPAPANQFLFRFADRGRPDTVRLDLSRRLPVDSFETWSQRIFGRVVLASDDEDGDSRRNDSEFAAGTNPLDAMSFTTNHPPVVGLATNRLLIAEGTTLRVTNLVSDVDIPTNRLTWRMVGGPVGSAVTAVDGIWTWTPSEAQGPITNEVVIAVEDDGLPPLSATNRFTVVVLKKSLVVPVIETIRLLAGDVRIQARGSGRIRIESSGDMVSWSVVGVENLQPGEFKEIVLPLGAGSAQFYRLVAIP